MSPLPQPVSRYLIPPYVTPPPPMSRCLTWSDTTPSPSSVSHCLPIPLLAFWLSRSVQHPPTFPLCSIAWAPSTLCRLECCWSPNTVSRPSSERRPQLIHPELRRDEVSSLVWFSLALWSWHVCLPSIGMCKDRWPKRGVNWIFFCFLNFKRK
jgi:hypothetical protein